MTRINTLNKVRVAAAELKQLLKQKQLECGPMPNVMAALPNMGDVRKQTYKPETVT